MNNKLLVKRISFRSRLSYLVLVASFSILSPDNFCAQSLRFHQPSIEISQNTITALVEDNLGFLWIGTQYGLNRYDGENCQSFYSGKDIPNSSITCLLNDNTGNIWIGTESGIGILDGRSQKFITNQATDFLQRSLKGIAINFIFEDSERMLWIGTESHGVYRWNPKLKNVDKYLQDDDFLINPIANTITGIAEDDSGNIYVTTYAKGIYIFDKIQESFFRMNNNQDVNEMTEPVIRVMHKGLSGSFWLGTTHGLRKLEINGSHSYTLNNPSKSIKQLYHLIDRTVVLSIYEDASGTLWIGTENEGLITYSLKNQSVSHYFTDPFDESSLSNNSIWSLYADRNGTLWIGTYKKGLNKIDPYEESFYKITTTSGLGRSLSYDLVSAFTETRDHNLWIGTDGGGLNYLDWDTKKIQHINSDPSSGLSSPVIISLMQDQGDNLWVGTWGSGIYIKPADSQKFELINNSHLKLEPPSGKEITEIYQGSRGEVWVGSFREGLDLYLPNENKHFHYQSGTGKNKITSNHITSIVQDQNHHLWLGTSDRGLDRITFDDRYKIVEVKNFSSSDSTGNLESNVNHLYIDADERLWIGTNGSGLFRTDLDGKEFVHYSMSEGLPSDVIYGILEDDTGKIWISTNQGLAVIDVSNTKIRVFDRSDGLQHSEFTVGACLRKKDGNLIFGGIDGMNYFKANVIDPLLVSPSLHITALRVEGAEYENDNFRTDIFDFPAEKIYLKSFQNDLRFDFSYLNFSHSTNNLYSFILENHNLNWSQPSHSNFARYLNVPPGKYTFKVRASAGDGEWLQESAQIMVEISNPWYWTLTARIFYAILFFTILILLYMALAYREKLRNRLEMEQLEKTKTLELSQMKSKFFSNISHEFKTPLTMIFNPLLELLQMRGIDPIKNHLLMIQNNADRIHRLINEILALSKAESGNLKLNVKKYDLNHFLLSQIQYFSNYAETSFIRIKRKIPQEKTIISFDRNKLEKAVSNVLSNAIKYTPKYGTVTVELKKQEDTVSIIISDSGIGIAKEHLPHIFDLYYTVDSKEHTRDTGIGLNLAKQYILLHNGTIEVDSQQNSGTTFTITLPLKREQDSDSTPLIQIDGQINRDFKNIKEVKDLQLLSFPENSFRKPILQKGPKSRILIAEDNDDIRLYLSNLLKNEFDLILASDGKNAFHLILNQMPDLVISDLMMPGLDGHELCEKVKNNEKTSHIIFVLLSVKSSDTNIVKGYQCGADIYLTKPFDPDILLLRISNALQKRRDFKQKFLSKKTIRVDPKEVKMTSADELLLMSVMHMVEKNISNSDFSVEELSRELGLSKSQLYRKMKAIVGQSTNEFIRTVRLKRAAQLLRQNVFTINEVTYQVGFNDLQYFRSCFKKQFGVNPSKYSKELAKG